MTVNLDTLPPEIILLLIDSGCLDVQDGLGLRQTCKALYKVAESRVFWLPLIRNCQEMGYALPFPPFRQVSTLSTNELIQVAVRFISIGDNLASPEPQFRSHWVLSLDEEESLPPINVFGILPNGHYVLIMHREGVFTLWDVRPTSTPGSGRFLARHEVPDGTVSMEYTTEGDDGTCIVVAALSEDIEVPTIYVFQFQLDFSSKGSSHGIPEVVQSDLAKFYIGRFRFWARIALQEGLCFVWYKSELEGKVTASILDYRSSKRMDLETDIAATTSPDACLCHGNLIFHHDKLTSAVVDAYFSVTQNLRPVVINSRPGDVDTIHKAPDRSAIIPLQPPHSSSTVHQEPDPMWSTIHPTNTPNANTLCGSPSIFATETLSPGYDWIPHLSARWMEPQKTLDMLRTGANTDAPLSRTWIDLEGPTSARESDGFKFLISTTCGLRMLWVSYLEDGDLETSDEEVLYFIPLLIPDDRVRGEDGKRILRLPINFENILTMDFSDESGTLVIASNVDENSEEGSEELMRQSSINEVLHVFQY